MLTLKAETRDIFGKKLKPIRKAGKLPVVMYGGKADTQPLFVTTGDFKKTLAKAGESTVVALEVEGKKHDVLIHDVDHHPVTGEPLHADLYVIDRTRLIKIDVPLRFEGVAPAVKDLGGTLVKVLHKIEIEVLPLNIPRDIEVNISALTTLESQILVKGLVLPSDVKVITPSDEVVAAVSVAKEEVVEEAAPVDLSAIEVEKKGKKEEEGEVAGAAPASDKAA